MNWLAEELAGHFDLYAMGPAGCRHSTIDPELHVARFVHERLSAPEAIERVAKALYEQSSAYKWNGLEWDNMPEDHREGIRKSAKVAVGALLGEAR